MNTLHVLTTLLIVFLSLPAMALEVFVDRDDDVQFIHLRGSISPGDAEKISAALVHYWRNSGLLLKVFRVDSRGGDVNEAIKIAGLIRGVYGSVKVINGKYCASSCFLLWLNGAARIASGSDEISDGGMLVVHRPYYADEKFNSASPEALGNRQVEAMKAMRAYLEDNFVPRTLIDEMLSRPSNDGYVLTASDIRGLGEIPPWFEEVSIARCNYRRGIVREIVEAQSRGRHDEAQRLRFLDNKIIECQHELRNKAGILFVKKLAKGWKPWLVERTN